MNHIDWLPIFVGAYFILDGVFSWGYRRGMIASEKIWKPKFLDYMHQKYHQPIRETSPMCTCGHRNTQHSGLSYSGACWYREGGLGPLACKCSKFKTVTVFPDDRVSL